MKIFVADDDLDDQYLIKEAFQVSTFSTDIVPAYNGAQLLEMLNHSAHSENTPDIILLDLNMPVMDGLTALTQIKRIDGCDKIPVYMLSTSKHDSDRKACELLGAKRFFTKPATFDQLQLVARQILYQEFPSGKENVS